MSENDKKGIYTQDQLDVINGVIPIEEANGQTLRRIEEKALRTGNNEIAEKVREEFARRKLTRYASIKEQRLEANPYTESQMDIVNGVTPIEEASGHTLSWIRKRALHNGDGELIAKIDAELTRRKAARAYEAIPKKPKKQEQKPKFGPKPYTAKQMDIINGKVSLEAANGYVLQSFYKKALEHGDIVLAETVKNQLNITKKASRRRNKRLSN